MEPVDILLVEDSRDDAELTLHVLSQQNIARRVEVARDGQAALDFLFAEGTYASRAGAPLPRLVLLDLKLPKIDGLQVLARLKRDPRTQHLPVVILTSSREDRDRLEGYTFGVNSYIQKPVDFAQFREVVRQLGIYWMGVNVPPPHVAEA